MTPAQFGVGVPGQMATLARPHATLARPLTQTPAQAHGHPTLDDVPVSGPTDPGILKADCWFAQNVLPTPAQAACVDCKGPIPMLNKGLLGEWSGGFGVGAAGDPDAWVQLDKGQQTWVMNTLVKLDSLIRAATPGTSCSTFGPSISAAGRCFQFWFNSAKLGLTKRDGSPVVLRTDGVFDQDTLDALRTVTSLNAKDFPTPFPGTEMAGTGKTGLSKGAMFGIAAGGAAVLGGIAYVATRKKSRRSRRR